MGRARNNKALVKEKETKEMRSKVAAAAVAAGEEG
jgi:hypothetical protein